MNKAKDKQLKEEIEELKQRVVATPATLTRYEARIEQYV